MSNVRVLLEDEAREVVFADAGMDVRQHVPCTVGKEELLDSPL